MIQVEPAYEHRIAPARSLIAEHTVLKKLLSPAISPSVLERFLIEYCSLGVQITRPVESWIARAGGRCRDLGFSALGDSLCAHAKHEAGHELMFVADTHKLVAHWNERYQPKLDASALISRPATHAMRHYIALHEDCIASDYPFAQLAIELEIEQLSVTVLPALLAQFRRVLGDDIMSSLSFLASHAELDVGHTQLNSRMVNELLRARPDTAAELGRVGSFAMFIYMRFFEECLQEAENGAAT